MEPIPTIDCPNCDYPNDENNKFCRECGTRLYDLENYCPRCDRVFYDGEKYCTECGTKLIDKLKPRSKSTSNRFPPVGSKPVSINSYKVRIDGNTRKDTVSIGYDSPSTEFLGKTREELERELEFVTSKYADCIKAGDYMASHYKKKKEILERLLGI